MIPNLTPNTQSIPLENCKTKHFCYHLQHDQQTQPPNHPIFNHTFWKDTYPNLATNKQGDVNWKIVHRFLPTALSLYRATVYHTPNCHRCNTTENIEHIFLYCPTSLSLWTSVQTYINKMTNNTLQLTDTTKLFGLTRTSNIIHDKDTLNLLSTVFVTYFSNIR